MGVQMTPFEKYLEDLRVRVHELCGTPEGRETAEDILAATVLSAAEYAKGLDLPVLNFVSCAARAWGVAHDRNVQLVPLAGGGMSVTNGPEDRVIDPKKAN